MNRRRLYPILTVTLVFVLLFVIGVWAVKRYAAIVLLKSTIGTPTKEEMYPKAARLPPRVKASTADLLRRLERVLSAKCPVILANLNPGLSADEITRLKNDSGIKLSKELEEVYAWHNGCKGRTCEFVPGHTFQPLESVIADQRRLAEQNRKMNDVQRDVWKTYVSHTDNWLRIFPDAAGDGYFYDPTRTYEEGALFYCFIEMGAYRYFTSLENLLAYFLECYGSGIYSVGANGKDLSEDFKKAADVVKRYAECNPQ
jgi:cell wall assembly regulator SMI1